MTLHKAKQVIAKKYGYETWLLLWQFHKALSDLENFEVYLDEASELYAKTKVTESNVDLRNINIQLREQRNQYTIEQIKKHLDIAANEADVIYRGHSFGDYIVDKESITDIKIELT
jgi:hypothetical protein